jgi:hypothetical protein
MNQQDVIILTRYVEDKDDSRGGYWKAWVKEHPGVWEADVKKEVAIKKLELSIPIMLGIQAK